MIINSINPELTLILSGYFKTKDGSYVKSIDDKHRFHARIFGNQIRLHYDSWLHYYHRSQGKGKLVKKEANRISAN